jgi:hypothetical protein
MLFYYRRTALHPVYPEDLCFAYDASSRGEFLNRLHGWNDYYGERFVYVEVPYSCVKKLFGSISNGLCRAWPRVDY